MLSCTFVYKKAGVVGERESRTGPWLLQPAEWAPQGDILPFMPAGRREIGQGSSQLAAQAGQYEDVIFQAAAKGNFSGLREDKGVIGKASEMITQPLYPAPCPSAWKCEEG